MSIPLCVFPESEQITILFVAQSLHTKQETQFAFSACFGPPGGRTKLYSPQNR